MYKNISGQKIAVYAHDVTNDIPKTGDASNITAYISKDGASPNPTNDTNPTELDSSNSKGIYIFDMEQSETNANSIILTATSSTSGVDIDPVFIYTIPAAPIDWQSGGRLNGLLDDVRTKVIGTSGEVIGIPNANQIADQVWDEMIGEHDSVGSTGLVLSNLGYLDVSLSTRASQSSVDMILAMLPTSGENAQAVWNYGNRTLTISMPTSSQIADAVWTNANRTLTQSFATSGQNAQAVWEYITRTLTSTDASSGQIASAVWNFGTRGLTESVDIGSVFSTPVSGVSDFMDKTSQIVFQRVYKQSATDGHKLYVYMVDNDGNPVTGLTNGTVTQYISKDGDNNGVPDGQASFNEIDNSGSPGLYTVTPSSTDLNAIGPCVWRVVADNCRPFHAGFIVETATNSGINSTTSSILASVPLLPAGVWTYGTRGLTQEVNIGSVKGAAVSNINDFKADVSALATSGQIANAVWASPSRTLTITIPSSGDIANAVWEELELDHTTVGTMGYNQYQTALKSDLSLFGNVLLNKNNIIISITGSTSAAVDTLPSDVWSNPSRTLTSSVSADVPTAGEVATAVWSNTSRTLTQSVSADVPTAGEVANAVWDKSLETYTTSGNAGYDLHVTKSNILSAISNISTLNNNVLKILGAVAGKVYRNSDGTQIKFYDYSGNLLSTITWNSGTTTWDVTWA